MSDDELDSFVQIEKALAREQLYGDPSQESSKNEKNSVKSSISTTSTSSSSSSITDSDNSISFLKKKKHSPNRGREMYIPKKYKLADDSDESGDDVALQDEQFLLQYEKLLLKVQKKAKQIAKQKKEIKAQRHALEIEKQIFAKEKAEFESDKILSSYDGENFTKLSVKYTKLEDKYKADKAKWEKEKAKLQSDISSKDKEIESLKAQISQLNASQKENKEKEHAVLEENEFIEEIIDPAKNTIVIANEMKPKPNQNQSNDLIRRKSPQRNNNSSSFLSKSPIQSQRSKLPRNRPSQKQSSSFLSPPNNKSPSSGRRSSFLQDNSFTSNKSPSRKQTPLKIDLSKPSSNRKSSFQDKSEINASQIDDDQNDTEIHHDLSLSSSSDSIRDPVGGIVIKSETVTTPSSSPAKESSETQTQPPTPIITKQEQTQSKSPPRTKIDINRMQRLINNQYPLKFTPIPTDIVEERIRKDGKRLLRFADGSSGTLFTNGSLKIIRGNYLYLYYDNGDISIQFPDGTVGYFYNDKGTVELNLNDKSVIYKFPNGQIEQHFPNGEKEIEYANGFLKHIEKDGTYTIYDKNGNLVSSP